jgi:bifunctional UDP-N-acetylglucosamine pyrophosphorylase/glucosamine-1-phosphate N-acetyltransferase
MSICALIPAAGKGTRLGLSGAKILVPIYQTEKGTVTIWNILRDLLLPVVDSIHVVVAPPAASLFLNVLGQSQETKPITTSVQVVPLGMGDAIFGAEPCWRSFETILIVWGDQVNLSAKTIQEVVRVCGKKRTIVLPLTKTTFPYVQYDMNQTRLLGIRQRREGDLTDEQGLSDVGVFGLSVEHLADSWRDYLKMSAPGNATGEINFLPFLTFLSNDCKWDVKTIDVEDANEARGVNTQEDLAFAKTYFLARSGLT